MTAPIKAAIFFVHINMDDVIISAYYEAPFLAYVEAS